MATFMEIEAQFGHRGDCRVHGSDCCFYLYFLVIWAVVFITVILF